MDKLLHSLELEYQGRQQENGEVSHYVFRCNICSSTIYFAVDKFTPSDIYEKIKLHRIGRELKKT